jgi:hypothetical protein
MLTPGRYDDGQADWAEGGGAVPVHRRKKIALIAVFIHAA